jgi:hypothetical protein
MADLLVKIACFVEKKNIFLVLKVANVKKLVQGEKHADPSPSVRVPCCYLYIKPRVVFTTLHSLRKLWKGPISYSIQYH